MAIIKGVAKYACILVLLVLGLALVLGAVMVLFPSVSMFGFRYCSLDSDYTYRLNVGTGEGEDIIPDFHSIEIDADRFNVEIISSVLNKVIIDGDVRINGFYKTTEETKDIDVKELFAIKKPYVEDGVLKIQGVMQEGMLNNVRTNIQIAIPESQKDLVNITSNTGSGSFTMSASEAEDIHLLEVSGLLKVVTTTGRQTIDSCGITNLESISEKGDINIERLKVKDNVVDENRVSFVNGNVKIVNKYGKITFGRNVNIGGNCEIESDSSVISMNDIAGSLAYKGESSYITLNNITGTVYLDSSDVYCKIKSINKDSAELVLSNGNKAELDIGSINAATVVVNTKSGDINIGALKTNTANFDTTTGNITIDELLSQVKATTTTGNITITQGDFEDCQLNNGTMFIDVSTKKGTVVLDKINAKLHANVSENGTLEVGMVGVLDDCQINGGDNFVKVKLPRVRLNTITESVSGSVSFNLLEHIYEGKAHTFCRVLLPDDGTGEEQTLIEEDRAKGVKLVTITSKSGAITVSANA